MKDLTEVKAKVAGATYLCHRYKVGGEGLEDVDGAFEIQFVKGAKNDPNVFSQEGVVTESLLTVCKRYLEDVNIGDLKNEYTTNAIAHIEAALKKLQQRAEDRKNRSVQNTYKK